LEADMANASKERNFNYAEIKRFERQLTEFYKSLMEIQKDLVVTDTEISDSLTGESKSAYVTSVSAIQEKLKTELKELRTLIGLVSKSNKESRDKDIDIGKRFEIPETDTRNV